MFLDYVKISIKAGNGGNGAVSFHREKYVPNGGPDGGDGGTGGNIIFIADKNQNTLSDFKYKKRFFAENGEKGGAKLCSGKCAEDLIIKVPLGTVVRDNETGKVICDLLEEGESKIVLAGGKGGKGNSRFKNSNRQAPSFSQQGELTDEHLIILELKTIADVGLVGFPNVGKSTLLSVLTSARPKIANYHFTTLTPNLGVVKMYDNSFCIADIPGLIEGASEGAGLGHYFLRHIERVRLIVHIVDLSGIEGRDPVADFKSINDELNAYSEKLSKIPQIVCASKADLITDENALKNFENEIGKKVFLISSVTNTGLEELLGNIWEELEKIPPTPKFDLEDTVTLDVKGDQKFTVQMLEDGSYLVDGGLVDFLVQNVTLSSPDSFAFFQKVLRDRGVFTSLKKIGMKEGDTVVIGDIEFEWLD
ncbi:MAG: GTPase ObgE [Clostridia bacterium]|nr:GTPase ObgE [Clostridia bacterium]